MLCGKEELLVCESSSTRLLETQTWRGRQFPFFSVLERRKSVEEKEVREGKRGDFIYALALFNRRY
jgi:hypothetical protein